MKMILPQHKVTLLLVSLLFCSNIFSHVGAQIGEPCDDSTVLPSNRQCCGGVINAVDPDRECCGQTTRLIATQDCCEEVVVNGNMNHNGRKCCGATNYPVATQDCCDGVVVNGNMDNNGRKCCGTTNYPVATQQCCDGVVHNGNPSDVIPRDCCGTDSYSLSSEGCCRGQTVYWNGGDVCCPDGTVIAFADLGTQSCPKSGGHNDPHFRMLNGTAYKFSDRKYNVEKTLFDYAVPCVESDFKSVMPIKIMGKHMRIHPKNSRSGIEYIILQLFDDESGDVYAIWLSSVIHAWMKFDQTNIANITLNDEGFAPGLMYYDIVDDVNLNYIGVEGFEPLLLAQKFKVDVLEFEDQKKIRIKLDISGECDIDVMMAYQDPTKLRYHAFKNPVQPNGRHGMHRFEIDMPCYHCSTCGLLGSNLCAHDNEQDI